MPVDQTGEVILFVSDGDYVEAHVQIQYDGGDADQFAWLVPVPAIPEIEVGSWRLVQGAMSATRPVYRRENNQVCEDTGPDDGGVGFIEDPDGGGASFEPDVGPEVVAQDTAGAFEYAVLQGGSADTVNQWLIDNDYATDDEAPEILDTYIAEGHVFVAFRLRHGAEVEDIHPVVIRYQGTEPCIPLRLTRIAAKEDMDITALFLGDTRVVPTNYRHVLLNRVRLDWSSNGGNYPELVSLAVDAPGADGRAFVTEYAGPSAEIDGDLWLSTEGYDSSVFVDITVTEVITALQAQGLMSCDTETCTYNHELVPSLVHEFLPVPMGLTDAQFYGCLACYVGLIDMAAWDGAAFAAAYDERIVAPIEHGQELLAMWPYITRMYTRISPHEMITDPMFAELEDLDDVPSRHGAQRDTECCGYNMVLPGGRVVFMENSFDWPQFTPDMPWAERIEEYAKGGGAPITLVNNTELIDQLLAEWNAQAPCGDEMDDGGVDTGNSGTSGGGSGGGGTTVDGTTGGDVGSATAEVDDAGDGMGCGCRQRTPGPTPWLWLLLGLGLRTRRKAG